MNLLLQIAGVVGVGSSAVLGHVNCSDNVLNGNGQMAPAILCAQFVIFKPLDKIYQLIEPLSSAALQIAPNRLRSGEKFGSRINKEVMLSENIRLPNAGINGELALPVSGRDVHPQPIAKKQSEQEGDKTEEVWAVRIQWAIIMGLIGFIIGYGPERRSCSSLPPYQTYRSWPNEKVQRHAGCDAQFASRR